MFSLRSLRSQTHGRRYTGDSFLHRHTWSMLHKWCCVGGCSYLHLHKWSMPRMWWGFVGGCLSSLHLHTWSILHKWWGAVWGGVMCTFLALAHMVDATQVMGCVGMFFLALHLHTWSMLRKWWVVVGGDVYCPCTCTLAGRWLFNCHTIIITFP